MNNMKKNELGVIPVFSNIFITVDKMQQKTTESGIITGDVKMTLNDKQRVLAVGPDCPSYIKENDIVVLAAETFAKMKRAPGSIGESINGNEVTEYVFPVREVNGRDVMLITPRNIEYVIPINSDHNGDNIKKSN